MEETSIQYRDVVAEHKAATDRLHELMNEYLAAKKAEREDAIASLHPSIRKRVSALKNLQMKTIEYDAEFHRGVYDLERNFQGKHDLVFKKRSGIVNGNYEPSDEECKLSGMDLDKNTPAEGQQEPPQGIPNF